MTEVLGVGLAVLTVLLLALVVTAALLGTASLVRRLRGLPSPEPTPRTGRHDRGPDRVVLVGACVVAVGLAVAVWGLLGR